MAITPHYHSSYPRSGELALLCEGDVVGYEVSMLRRWIDGRMGANPLVDFWPCGTGLAIFGVSDAIGRSRPIIVVEDRDYRSLADATKQAESKKNNRSERGIDIREWHVWNRNEIENYLIEPEVVLPCLAHVFGCSKEEVSQILSGLLPSLAVHQSFQHAFYQARNDWVGTDPSPHLPNNLSILPRWNDADLRAETPDFVQALKQFSTNVQKWRAVSIAEIGDLVDNASKCYELWKNPKLTDSFWRHDWAGKDVLQWLRIALTARFGWRNRETGNREKLSWSGLNRKHRDEKDRPIESELKPFLVQAFVDYLSSLQSGEIYHEWNGLLSSIAVKKIN